MIARVQDNNAVDTYRLVANASAGLYVIAGRYMSLSLAADLDA
ncbi:hypothetical protein [Sphingomonas sp. Leaf343]|nr:hypothetical protein [Sphingomonas sp. Leaf343]